MLNPSKSCQCKSTFFKADACCKEQHDLPLIIHRVHISTLVRIQQLFQPLVVGFLGGLPPRVLVFKYQVSHHVGRCVGNILLLLSLLHLCMITFDLHHAMPKVQRFPNLQPPCRSTSIAPSPPCGTWCPSSIKIHSGTAGL